MEKKIAVIIGIVFWLNLFSSAMVIHTCDYDKEKCIRTESGIFDEDYLFIGKRLHFSGEAEDLVFLGKDLTVNGKVKLGLISFAQNVFFSGEAGNGIISASENLIIDGRITGNNYVACRSINISDKAQMNGNLFVGCAKLTIEGRVIGDLYAGAGEIIINNEIKGNVFVRTGSITIGDKGKITGNLTYSAKEKLSDKEIKKVYGIVKIDEVTKKDSKGRSFYKKSMPLLIALGIFLSFVLTGSLLLFFPAFRRLNAKLSERFFWSTSLWGLIPVLMYPAIIVLCFILVFTIPLALILILAFGPLFFLANIIGSTLLGKYIVLKFKWRVVKRHFQFLIGALAGAILSTIPYVNVLAFLFISSLGFGVYISFLFNKKIVAELM